jgi:hypothetical protein
MLHCSWQHLICRVGLSGSSVDAHTEIVHSKEINTFYLHATDFVLFYLFQLYLILKFLCCIMENLYYGYH